jgi:hypothetical protein
VASTELAVSAMDEIRKTIRQARSQHGQISVRRTPNEVLRYYLRGMNRTVDQLCQTLSKLTERFDPFCEEYIEASTLLVEARRQIRDSDAVLARRERENA